MAKSTADLNKLLDEYDVLFGGYGPSVEIEDFNDTEMKLFNRFIDDSHALLRRISPLIADDFKAHKDVFLTFGKVFKAKINGKAFGGIAPTSGQFGVGLLIPQDIKYAADVPTNYNNNSWTINLTAGTPAYLLGSSSDFYKASDVVGSRSLIVIMKNGLVEVGTTPKINQLLIQTSKVNYAPFNIHTLVDLPIEREKKIYQYNVPFVIPVFFDFGIKVSVMPVASGVSDLRLIGVIFYEYDFKSSLKYIS